MSNIVLQRLNQRNQRIVHKPMVFPMPKPRELSPPIPSEELKKIFMSEIQEQPAPALTPNERIFNGLEDFVNWYLPERTKNVFTEHQRIALNSLFDARLLIAQGCKCKEAERRKQAEAYFKTFWTNNQHNDLPKRIRELVGVTVKFAISSEVFLIVP